MSTRLTPEREAEIRRYADGARSWMERHPDAEPGESGKVMLDLLGEIDALREENRTMQTTLDEIAGITVRGLNSNG